MPVNSSESLVKIILGINYLLPIRELLGSLIQSLIKDEEIKACKISVSTETGHKFDIISNNSDSWSYNENGLLSEELEEINYTNVKEFLLDGKPKGVVSLICEDEETAEFFLGVISEIVKKKLIFDRDNISNNCAIVEKVLRKGNHDIRSPFFGVSGFAQLINQKTDDPEVKQYCKTMLESLERVESIMTELVSGLGDKPLRMKPSTISLSETVMEIAQKSKEMYARCNIDLTCESDDNYHVSVDPELFKNAVYGVLNNAREEVTEGGSINITISKSDDGKNVSLVIKDTGKGIPADIIDSVFKPLYKINKMGDHLGLGLSNSLNIIKSHGGDIRIRNNLEKNTEFVIDLPLAEKED